MKTSSTHQVIKRLIPLLAVWVVSKVLETPRAKGALQEIDSRAYVQKRKTMRTRTFPMGKPLINIDSVADSLAHLEGEAFK